MNTAFDIASTEPWLITEAGLDQVLAVANRADLDIAAAERARAAYEASPEAVAMRGADRLQGAARATVRDGVAVVPVIGPIFRYANLFTALSGATSTDMIGKDVQAALDAPQVKSIVMTYNSPGGISTGIADLAQELRRAGTQKPITAYVGDMAASAAYWLATSANDIVLSPTALVGSIGAVMNVVDTSRRDAKTDVHRTRIVSSQSPNKALDPATRSGEDAYLAILDALAEQFIEHVAQARGVTPERVAAEFGKGGLIPRATDAVKLGMADRIGTFEGLLRDLTTRRQDAGGGSLRLTVEHKNLPPLATIQENNMADKALADLTATEIKAGNPAAAKIIADEAFAAGRAEGAKASTAEERARCEAILTSAAADKQPATARHLAFKNDMPAEAAIAMLDTVVAAAPSPAGGGLDTRMAGAKPPQVGVDAGAEGEPKPHQRLLAAHAMVTGQKA